MGVSSNLLLFLLLWVPNCGKGRSVNASLGGDARPRVQERTTVAIAIEPSIESQIQVKGDSRKIVLKT
jgi:hypothetical protein